TVIYNSLVLFLLSILRFRLIFKQKLNDVILQVCLACLLPLFLVPIVNILPLLYYFIMGKIYRVFGWEYRKPERAPPVCPYKPPTNRVSKAEADVEPVPADPVKPGSVDVKQD
ncbi:hypothetical protein D0Y65_036661, partial [Glycine soja]